MRNVFRAVAQALESGSVDPDRAQVVLAVGARAQVVDRFTVDARSRACSASPATMRRGWAAAFVSAANRPPTLSGRQVRLAPEFEDDREEPSGVNTGFSGPTAASGDLDGRRDFARGLAFTVEQNDRRQSASRPAGPLRRGHGDRKQPAGGAPGDRDCTSAGDQRRPAGLGRSSW